MAGISQVTAGQIGGGVVYEHRGNGGFNGGLPHPYLKGPSVPIAFALLLSAYEKARQLEQQLLHHAVPYASLQAVGLSDGQILSLCKAGSIEHYQETTRRRDRTRRFRRIREAQPSKLSCFALTEEGLADAYELAATSGGNSCLALQPRWLADVRELWFRDVLAKCFPHAAPCQEEILAAFQDQQWPRHIDNPLRNQKDPYESLRNAVKKLNRQQNPVMDFSLDGAGEGVIWRPNPDRTHCVLTPNLDKRSRGAHNRSHSK
jgi:hypothetical protein